MFKVKREDGKGLVMTVYAVKSIDNDCEMFLFYDDYWFWDNSYNYVPFEN